MLSLFVLPERHRQHAVQHKTQWIGRIGVQRQSKFRPCGIPIPVSRTVEVGEQCMGFGDPGTDFDCVRGETLGLLITLGGR